MKIIDALALAGPTAVGKSHLALTLAQKINGEIVSVDAGAVYRDMNIGSAKPSPAAQRMTPHHLLDVRNPDESFNVGDFCRLALAAADDIRKRAKAPLFVGGTMMYYKALREGLHDLPPASPPMRAALNEEIKNRGLPAMHAELMQLDENTAKILQANDGRRIGRALEVFRITGKPLSLWLKEKRRLLPLRLHAVLLMPSDRRLLRARIGERLNGMFADGLVEETDSVIRRFQLPPTAHVLRLVGYKQAAAFLRGETDEMTMRKKRRIRHLSIGQTATVVVARVVATAVNNRPF